MFSGSLFQTLISRTSIRSLANATLNSISNIARLRFVRPVAYGFKLRRRFSLFRLPSKRFNLVTLNAISLSFLPKREHVKLDASELQHIKETFNVSSLLQDDEVYEEQCFQAVYRACEEGKWRIVKENRRLLSRLTNSLGQSLAAVALKRRNKKVLIGLKKASVSLKYRDQNDNTLLHLAAKHNLHDYLKPLIAIGGNLEDKNIQGETPAFIAMRYNQEEALEELLNLQEGVVKDLPSKDILHKTIEIDSKNIDLFEYGLIHESKECLDTLINKRPDKIHQKKSQDGGNLLHSAIWHKKEDLLYHLLYTHYDKIKTLVNERDNLGRPPCQVAAYLGRKRSLGYLKSRDANIYLKDSEGRDIEFWAAKNGNSKSIKWLWSHNYKLKNNYSVAPEGQRETLRDLYENLAYAMEDSTNYWPENAVLQGGGAKGFAYVGVAQALEEHHRLEDLKRVAGTSAGAIFAALLAIGYTAKDLETALEKDFNDFFDPATSLTVPEFKKLKAFLENLSRSQRPYEMLLSSLKPKRQLKDPHRWFAWPFRKYLASYEETGFEVLRLWCRASEIGAMWNKKLGLFKGEAFRLWIEEKIRDKVGKPNFTFEDLRKCVDDKKEGYKDLYLYATDLIGKPHKFSSDPDDIDSRNVIISDAVRASMSIPYLFEPHPLYQRINHGRKLLLDETGYITRYIDGGLLKNFPLGVFDKQAYESLDAQDPDRPIGNSRTWGFRFIKDDLPKDVQTLASLTTMIAGFYFNAEEILHETNSFDDQRIIGISSQGVGTTDFGLDPKRREKLIRGAYEKTMEFIASKKLLPKKSIPYPGVERKKKKGKFYVEAPDDNFIGREKELAKLKSILANRVCKEELCIKVLVGDSGVGKSQLARAFAHRYFDQFSLIWYISRSNEEAAYARLAEKLNIRNKGEKRLSSHELRKEVHKHLEESQEAKPWCLIYDDPKQRPQLLPTRGGSILFTSNSEKGWDKQWIEKILPFSIEDALNLMEKISGEKRTEDMTQLIEQLGRIPQLISLAAHDVHEERETNKPYNCQRLREQLEGETNTSSIFQRLVLRKLERIMPESLEWLGMCSHLQLNSLFEETIDEMFELWPTGQVYVEKDDLFNLLTQRGVMQYDQGNRTFSIHESWRKAIRAYRKEETILEDLSEVVGSLYIYAKKENLCERWMPHVRLINRSPFFGQLDKEDQLYVMRMAVLGEAESGNKAECFKQMSKALQTLRSMCCPPVRTQFPSRPFILNLGQHKLPSYYKSNNISVLLQQRENWKYNKFLKLHRDVYLSFAKEIRKDFSGQLNDPIHDLCKISLIRDTIYHPKLDHTRHNCLNSLALSLQSLGFYEDALDYYKHLLATDRIAHGEERATTLNNTASVLESLGRYQESLKMHRRALALYEKMHRNKPHGSVANSLRHIGSVLTHLNQREESLKAKRRALSMCEKIHHNKPHRDIANALTSVGATLTSLNRDKESLKAHQRARSMYEKIHRNKPHQDVANALTNVGATLTSLNRDKESLKAHQRALSMYEKIHRNKPHQDVANALTNVANVLAVLNAYEEALKTSKRALTIFEEINDDANRSTIALLKDFIQSNSPRSSSQ